jgi:hypothetical protein
MDGTAVQLSINFMGNIFPVASLAPFTVSFNKDGVYPVILTASDTNGASSQVVRNMIYDTTPPVAGFPSKYSSLQCTYNVSGAVTSCESACPASGGICNQTSFGGTVEAGASVHIFSGAGIQLDNDTSPVIYSNSGRTWSQTQLSARDPYDTLIKVTDAAGNIKQTSQAHPDGNILTDTAFNQADVDLCLSKVSTYGPTVPAGGGITFQQLSHADVAPLLNGNINPDGYLDIVDCIMISRKLNGMVVPF